MSGLFEKWNRRLLEMTAGQLAEAIPELTRDIPELAPTVGFDQRSPHHKFDLFTHIALVTAAVPGDPALRWAALFHDVGKVETFTLDATGRGHFYGHAQASARTAREILRRLGAPGDLAAQAVTLIEMHMSRIMPEALEDTVRELGPDIIRRLLILQRADMSSKGVSAPGELDQFTPLFARLDKPTKEQKEA